MNVFKFPNKCSDGSSCFRDQCIPSSQFSHVRRNTAQFWAVAFNKPQGRFGRQLKDLGYSIGKSHYLVVEIWGSKAHLRTAYRGHSKSSLRNFMERGKADRMKAITGRSESHRI